MKKVYIGIDAHKDTNVIALAFAGDEPPKLHGTFTSDLRSFVDRLRKILKQYDLKKDDGGRCQ